MVVAPMMLLVTKGLSFTNAFAKVDGAIPYFLANLKYDSISVKPKKATDNQLGHIEINIQTLKDKI